MIFVALAFNLSQEQLTVNRSRFYYGMAFSVVIMVIVNYFVLQFLFGYYGKKQIKRISTILPHGIMPDDESNMSFTQLGEKVSELSQKSASEIDTMKGMEKYRKEYIGNVSHELKTPLFSIQGYVETLMEGGVENLAIRDKYLERIDKSVERLLDIVKDLDMLNQYEYGEITLNITRFDINALIREIMDMLDLDAERKNAKLQLQSPQQMMFVNADKQKIAQVLINLISNAVYYSNRENAQITVKTSPLRSQVLVEVTDNGMGIKKEFLPRIFERFYRVESSRNRREGGSGLGLAIVKHILEAHNESITVHSVYLEGTTFSFMLEKAV
jgi:two-component system phosphate regulon sensor histidine kinase PhoR